MLTQERLKELLNYNPDTGVFTWKVTGYNRVAGGKAGAITTRGYVRIPVNRRMYQASHLAYFYLTGKLPIAVIDHIDRDTSNNSWNNLRAASIAENSHNRKVPWTNKSTGIKGICLSRGGYNCKIRSKGITYRKYFTRDKLDDAIHWTTTMRNHLHKEFANHG